MDQCRSKKDLRLVRRPDWLSLELELWTGSNSNLHYLEILHLALTLA